MNPAVHILVKSLVKPFYRQNAGLFIFLIIVMFGAVGELDGAGTIDYHYSLISGMLNNLLFFLLVFFGWFLYANKCVQFVSKMLQTPDNSYLHILLQHDRKKLYGLLLLVELMLFLPVILYSIAIIAVAFFKKKYVAAIIVLLYETIICMISAGIYFNRLENGAANSNVISDRINKVFLWKKWYWIIFIRYLLNNRKLLLLSIKLYDCGILYLFMKNLTHEEYDITLGFIFYSFGLLGHGVIIHQLREFEELQLTFYRSLPISLLRRFLQYALLYFILLIPEIIILILLTSKYLLVKDAFTIIICSYSILLLLNSLLFIASYTMRDYLKMSFAIFCIIWLATFVRMLPHLAVIFFGLAFGLFLIQYYQYEINEKGNLTYRT